MNHIRHCGIFAPYRLFPCAEDRCGASSSTRCDRRTGRARPRAGPRPRPASDGAAITWAVGCFRRSRSDLVRSRRYCPGAATIPAEEQACANGSERLGRPDARLMIGIGPRLANDLGTAPRSVDLPRGAPEASAHKEPAISADEFGFAALWVRDIAMHPGPDRLLPGRVDNRHALGRTIRVRCGRLPARGLPRSLVSSSTVGRDFR